MARERDMRSAVREALAATGVFDEVHPRLPEAFGFGASAGAAAVVEPASWVDRDLYDAGPATGSIRTATLKLTFIARTADPEACDDACELLLEYARNALDGRALVPGFNVPDRTKLGDGRWLPSTPPERRIEADFAFDYLVDGWADNDTEE